MNTQEELKQFMYEYGFKPDRCKKEINDLPTLLQDDEKIYALMECQFEKVHIKTYISYGIAIVTNKRLLWYCIGFLGTITFEKIPLSKITSASYHKGLFWGNVRINATHNELKLDGCHNIELAEKFAKIINQLVAEANALLSGPPTEDNLTKLERLFELKERGILTEEEFLQQKIKLLS